MLSFSLSNDQLRDIFTNYKQCSECGDVKLKAEFYSKRRVCRVCHRKRVAASKETKSTLNIE